MDTMHTAAPPRTRWFAGLRRSRTRLLGGVAGGFADFWGVDPLLIRVLAGSPSLAAVLAYVGQVILGLYWLVPVTQLLWLIAATTIAGYLLGWVLIPQADAPSVARRFLAWGGPVGTVVKLLVGFLGLLAVGWLGLVALSLFGALNSLSPLIYVTGMVVAVGGLATFGVWLARGGDPRDAVHRLGSPGFGRTDAGPAAPNGEATAPLPARDPAAGEATLVLDSVDRARAAATAAIDARAAAAEAQRRARAEARRALRAERRDRNRWGWLVAAVTLITAGVLVLTDRAGVTSLGWSGIAMAGLALLTAGVLVGAWFGSARWLIAPALLLAGMIGAGSVAVDALDRVAAAPPIRVAPTSLPAEGSTGMGWEEGAVTVDLTDIRTLDGRGLSLSVDRGSLTVIVPVGQWTEISSRVGFGRTNLDLGRTNSNPERGNPDPERGNPDPERGNPDPERGNPDPERISLLNSGGYYLNMPDEPKKDAAPLHLSLTVGIGEITVLEQES